MFNEGDTVYTIIKTHSDVQPFEVDCAKVIRVTEHCFETNPKLLYCKRHYKHEIGKKFFHSPTEAYKATYKAAQEVALAALSQCAKIEKSAAQDGIKLD